MSRENEALCKIEHERINIEHIIATFNLLSEAFEDEAPNPDELPHTCPLPVLAFMNRFEMFQKVFYHGLWDLERVSENIYEAIDSATTKNRIGKSKAVVASP